MTRDNSSAQTARYINVKTTADEKLRQIATKAGGVMVNAPPPVAQRLFG